MVAHMGWSTPVAKARDDFWSLDGGKRGKSKRRAAGKRAKVSRRRNRR
jgi:hypothetical protein